MATRKRSKVAAAEQPAARVIGRPKQYKPDEIEELWEAFKADCDGKTVVRTEFSQRLGKFVTETIPSPITYTKLGFCLFIGLTRQSWHDYYESDPAFAYIATRIEQECERDVRKKFENKTIPSALSGLWMSKFGYSQKQETEVKGGVPVVIAGEDKLED